MTPALRALIERQGKIHRIDPQLLAAIVMVESGGRTFATRYEPGTDRYLTALTKWARATGVTDSTERVGQMTSWGLCQVMGFTARELGFKGLFPELCQSELGLEFGCRYLKRQQARFAEGPREGVLGFDEAVVVSYNAGSPRRRDDDGRWVNQGYIDAVRAHYAG